MKAPTVGAAVTPRFAVPAMYSGYAGRPVCRFEPGMVGTVVSVVPKVRIRRDDADPAFDRKPYFLSVAFVHPAHGKQRVALNYCNAAKA